MTPDRVGRGAASARAALAGNPSDGYGGAVIAVTLDGFRARATARAASGPSARPDSELVAATVRRFARDHCPEPVARTVEWETSVPRGVGLGGSSAIVIATLRALCELHGVSLERGDLAALALAVEREELGIAAGLQDRVAQSFGGLTFMDFRPGGPLRVARSRAVAPARGRVAPGHVCGLGHRARRPPLPVRCGRGSRHAHNEPFWHSWRARPAPRCSPAIARRLRRPSTQASTRALR